jgi:hypothetical protein
MSAPRPVQGLWIGPRLGVMQQLSIRSFLANGHPYRLYTYDRVAGVPDGAEVLPATGILPRERIWKYAEHDSVAGFSNHFRYKLLFERGGIWADLDVVCLRPLSLREHAFASEDTDDGGVKRATCFMAAPQGSPLMKRALDFCEAADVRKLRWGDTGPNLLTRMVDELGFHYAVLPPLDFCPVPHQRFVDLLSADPAVQWRTRARLQGAQGVHLWNELWRRHGIDASRPHPPGSLYERLKRQYLED